MEAALHVAWDVLRPVLAVAVQGEDRDGELRGARLQKPVALAAAEVEAGVAENDQNIVRRGLLFAAERLHAVKMSVCVAGEPDHALSSFASVSA